MTEPGDALSREVKDGLAALPRECAPRHDMEDNIVSRLVAAGDIGGNRMTSSTGVSVWWRHGSLAAAAALAVVALGFASMRGQAGTTGPEYMLLLHEDSLYQAPAPAHGAERVREYTEWADSLAAAGRLVKAAELDGTGTVTGFFIVSVPTDVAAQALAQASPHVRYRGTVEVRKLIAR